jgi:hypothetical protein
MLHRNILFFSLLALAAPALAPAAGLECTAKVLNPFTWDYQAIPLYPVAGEEKSALNADMARSLEYFVSSLDAVSEKARPVLQTEFTAYMNEKKINTKLVVLSWDETVGNTTAPMIQIFEEWAGGSSSGAPQALVPGALTQLEGVYVGGTRESAMATYKLSCVLPQK